MWISRKKYNELKEEAENLKQEKYFGLWDYQDKFKQLIKEKNAEIEKYKSLYMEEYQKRLELISLYRLKELDN